MQAKAEQKISVCEGGMAISGDRAATADFSAEDYKYLKVIMDCLKSGASIDEELAALAAKPMNGVAKVGR